MGKHPQNHRTAPMTKNYLAPNVHSAGAGKPCLSLKKCGRLFSSKQALWLQVREHFSLSHRRQDKDVKQKGKL